MQCVSDANNSLLFSKFGVVSAEEEDLKLKREDTGIKFVKLIKRKQTTRNTFCNSHLLSPGISFSKSL